MTEVGIRELKAHLSEHLKRDGNQVDGDRTRPRHRHARAHRGRERHGVGAADRRGSGALERRETGRASSPTAIEGRPASRMVIEDRR